MKERYEYDFNNYSRRRLVDNDEQNSYPKEIGSCLKYAVV